MQINKILCPIDFSEFSQSVNQYASVIASASDAQIVYLHVALSDANFSSYSVVDVQQEEAAHRKRLEQTKPTESDVEFTYEIKFGPASDAIVEFADEHDIDLIVMGTHGRTGWRRVTMGSIAEAVVRKANCPVLAIKSDTRIPQPS